MPPQNPLSFFRSVRGNPLTVLAVLSVTGRSMTRLELARQTGFSPETITRVLQELADYGWVRGLTPRGPWALNPLRPLPVAIGGTLGAGGHAALGGEPPIESDLQDSDSSEDGNSRLEVADSASASDSLASYAAALSDSARVGVDGRPARNRLGVAEIDFESKTERLPHGRNRLEGGDSDSESHIALDESEEVLSNSSSSYPESVDEEEEQEEKEFFRDALADSAGLSISSAVAAVSSRLTSAARPAQPGQPGERGGWRTVRDPARGPGSNLTEAQRFEQSHDLLVRAGVREPKATELARLPYARPTYVQAHLYVARKQGHPLGTAIYRIQHHWRVPHSPMLEHGQNCHCDWCDLDRRFESFRRRAQGLPEEEA